MSLTTLTVDGRDYPSYATLAEALIQLAIDPVRGPAWRRTEPDPPVTDVDRALALIAASASLDALTWAGRPQSEQQRPRAWPRIAISYPDGAIVPDGTLPVPIQQAAIILAANSLTTAAAVQPAAIGAAASRRIKAGAVEIEYFAPPAALSIQDAEAQRLIAPYLAAAAGRRAVATGTDGASAFEDRQAPDPVWYP